MIGDAPNTNLTRALALSMWIVGLVTTPACSSEDDSAYQASPMAFHAIGGWQVQLGGATVALDLQGADAAAQISHGVGAGAACVQQVEVSSALADGSCAIRLRFVDAPDVVGMRLAAASVEVRPADAPVCAPLVALIPDSAVTVLALKSGVGTLPIGGWAETLADQVDAPATLDKLYLWPRGEVKLAGGTAEVTVALGALRFGGDVTSAVDAGATCKPCSGGACASPYPTYRLRDLQPKSVAFNLEYGMDVFLDKPVLVILQAGW